MTDTPLRVLAEETHKMLWDMDIVNAPHVYTAPFCIVCSTLTGSFRAAIKLGPMEEDDGN